MRFRTFFFFLPHLATAGFFSDHVERNLNHEIDPCDDFYDHVCSTTTENSSLWQELAPRWYFDTLNQLASPKIHEFWTQVMGDLQKFPDNKLEDGDLEEFKKFHAQTGLPYMPSDSNFNDFLFLWTFMVYDSHYRLESTPHYNQLTKKMDDIFAVVKEIINEEFLNAAGNAAGCAPSFTTELCDAKNVHCSIFKAPWTKRHPEFVEFLETVKLVHQKNGDLGLEEKIIQMKAIYDSCLRLNVNESKALSVTCLNFAVAPAKLGVFNDNGKLIRVFDYFSDYGTYVSGFNAQYVPDFNIIRLRPALYTLEEDELPFMLGSLDFVLFHEMGHIFFHGKAVPSNSECFRKHMQNTCDSFISNKTECKQYDTDFHGRPAENGNYSRFGDDAADWIGMHAGLKSLRKYYPKIFTENEQRDADQNKHELMKKFFYAHAINWCSKNPVEGDPAHSPNKVRVNGIASSFDEFTEVFQCKRGNKMAKAATCLPFAGDGAPTRKRNGLQ